MKKLIAFGSLLLICLLWSLRGGAAPSRPKVIVLGFDGVDAHYTEKWMNEGKLPNLARLRAQGTFRPLRPTLPAQTPVSWSTFSTGIDPGRTGIFDFLRRDPKTYLPLFAAFDETTQPFLFGKRTPLVVAGGVFVLVLVFLYILLRALRRPNRIALIAASVVAVLLAGCGFAFASRLLPLTRPGVTNRRQGDPMWEVVSRAGLKARVVHVPVTFPATDFSNGHLLSGLGVPDISGRVGKPFYFTSELDFKHGGEGSNEFSIDVVQLEDNRGVIKTAINGPPNKLFHNPPYISCPITFSVAADRQSIGIEVGEQKLHLKQGQWSDWTDFVFPFNSLIKVHGVSRFYVLQVNPEIKVYLSPISFDPRNLPPGFNISAPVSWARELSTKFGRFKTIGWAIDTWAISEGFANETMFWDDLRWTVGQYRRLFQSFLQDDDDLLIQCFEFPDRVGHVFWRLIDTGHPAYDAALAAKWGDSLLKAYQLMDDIVGEAMAAADKNHASLIVLSDHGFATWRKSINYNTWLAQNGYLGLKSGVEVKNRSVELLFDQGQFWENVDWSKTRAYALGLGDVYINVKGREAQGIVEPADVQPLKVELRQKLEAIVDPANGEHPVSRVFFREEAYKQFDPNLIPDLFVTNSVGYRVSWQTSLGGVQKNLLEENKQVWSGDHCSVNPELVKGIFFYNHKLATDRAPYIADIYPTVLDLLGVKPPYALDGVALK